MAWHSKKAKREPWILPLLTSCEPGQAISKPRLTYVLKALEGPREDGSIIKKVSDGDLWIKGVFPAQAVNECFQGDSQEEDWDRSLILIKKYFILHEVHKGAHEFLLVVTELSFWQSQEGFALKSIPVYCMQEPEIQRKVDSIIKESRKISKLDEASMSSIALSDLVDQMSPPDDSQSAAAPKTPTKEHASGSSSQSSLADSPPSLNPDALLNELCVISSQERRQLEEIEEWREDYVPPKRMNAHSIDSTDSKEEKENSRGSKEKLGNSKPMDEPSLKDPLMLHKRTLDVSDSSGELSAPPAKVRKTTNLCNGGVDVSSDPQGKNVHTASVQVCKSLTVDSDPSEHRIDGKAIQETMKCLVSTSAQVGDSLQLMDSESSAEKDSAVQSERSDPHTRVNEQKDPEKDRNSNNLTPMVDTQAQRLPSSNESETAAGSKDSTTQESGLNGQQPHTRVHPLEKQPAKNIGDYQDSLDLSCSMNDVSNVKVVGAGWKNQEDLTNAARPVSPDHYQSTQRSESEHELHRPDFPVSPVPRVIESQEINEALITVPETSSPRRSSTDDKGGALKTGNQPESAMCVGGYFSAGISPPLVMPSTSHIGSSNQTGATELHSPLHPPARPSTGDYTPLLNKSSAKKGSPTKKSPTKPLPMPAIPSTSRADMTSPRTPAQKERRETMEEELRLAILSGRMDFQRSVEEDTQSVSSLGTVQLEPIGGELDIDPTTIDEEEKRLSELRKASSGIEIIDVKMKDVSPKDRKMQRRPTLEITALSPKKLNKFFSRSLSSSDSDGNSVSSSSSQQLKTFSIGKKINTFDVSLKIIDDVDGKRPSVPVKPTKSKTPAIRKGDISVLFSSPDRLRKSTSDPMPLSPDGSMIRKKKRIRLYKETMLMPVDENASQASQSQESSGSSCVLVQSSGESDSLLISNSSNETESQVAKQGKGTKKGKGVSKSSDEATETRKRPVRKRNTRSATPIEVVDSDDTEDLVTPMSRAERHKHKEQFLRKSETIISPTTTDRLRNSPRVHLADGRRDSLLTPSYSLTAAQRSKRRSTTPEGGDNSEADWTLPFTPTVPAHLPGDDAATDASSQASENGTSILMQLCQTCEEGMTDTQKQLMNIPLSMELSQALDNYLTLPKFEMSS